MAGKNSGSKKDGASKGTGAKGDRGGSGNGGGAMGGRGDSYERLFGLRRRSTSERTKKKLPPLR